MSETNPGMGQAFFTIKADEGRFYLLTRQFEEIARLFAYLDAQPRHDTVLDAVQLQACSPFDVNPYPLAFHRVDREVNVALEHLEHAVKSAEVFQGELKSKIRDRLSRLTAELNELNAAVGREWVAHRFINQPFAIRQAVCSGLVVTLSELHATVLSWLEGAQNLFVAPEAVARLKECQPRIRKLHAEIAKCRDNPSQKMGRKVATWQKEFFYIAQTVRSVKCKARYDHLRAGGGFIDRASRRYTWKPEFEGMDPWTFDPFGSEYPLPAVVP